MLGVVAPGLPPVERARETRRTARRMVAADDEHALSLIRVSRQHKSLE